MLLKILRIQTKIKINLKHKERIQLIKKTVFHPIHSYGKSGSVSPQKNFIFEAKIGKLVFFLSFSSVSKSVENDLMI